MVISTRSLERIYGIDTLLEAIRFTNEKNDDICFLLLGDGSLRTWVEDYIKHYNLSHAVHLTGRIDYQLLPDYFNEADLYVSTSYSDGTSVSLLEAMACGLPVIVSDLPSNREWVQPDINGWLVSPGNTEALGMAIPAVLGQKDKLSAMGQANLALVREKADWSKNSDLLLEAYERMAG